MFKIPIALQQHLNVSDLTHTYIDAYIKDNMSDMMSFNTSSFVENGHLELAAHSHRRRRRPSLKRDKQVVKVRFMTHKVNNLQRWPGEAGQGRVEWGEPKLK